jgi:hypothetical protein
MSLVEIAEEIRHDGLEPVMDARVLNLDQASLLARLDTPARDSVIEKLDGMRDRPVGGGWYLVSERQISDAENDTWKATELNGREGEIQRHVAGRLESIGARAYVSRVGADRLADDLREPLRVIADLNDRRRPNPTEREIALANGAIRAAVRDHAALLASDGVAHQLGRAKTAILAGYLNAKGARA